jgi:hypothetical protein
MSHLASVEYLLDGKYLRFLSPEETLFISALDGLGYGSWTASNASLIAEETFRFRDAYNVLRIQPLDASNISPGVTAFSVQHEPKVIPQSLIFDKLIFHTFIYPMAEIQASITLEDSNGVTISTEYITLPPMTWSLVKSPEMPVTKQTSAFRAFTKINFMADASLDHVHIAHPMLTNSYGFTDNQFLRECITYIPRFLVETDEAQEDPKFPMFRYMDVGLAYADRSYRQALDFAYRDIASGFRPDDTSTRSKLVDPVSADPRYLPWLSQFVGVTRKSSRAGATPWGNLPTTWEEIHLSIDPTPDITYPIDSINVDRAFLGATPEGLNPGDTVSISGTTNFNGQFIIVSISGNQVVLDPAISETDEYTGTMTLVDNSWFEIESFNTQDSNFVNAQRNLIITARTGHNAGTKQAIIDTLNEILLATKSYIYSIDPFNSPWVISIKTLTSETPGEVDGLPSQLILDQLASVKPMGFVVEHECVDSLDP